MKICCVGLYSLPYKSVLPFRFLDITNTIAHLRPSFRKDLAILLGCVPFNCIPVEMAALSFNSLPFTVTESGNDVLLKVFINVLVNSCTNIYKLCNTLQIFYNYSLLYFTKPIIKPKKQSFYKISHLTLSPCDIRNNPRLWPSTFQGITPLIR